MSKFADKLKQLRKKRGLTQQQLGDLFNITKTGVFYWETGRSEPSLDMIKEIANYFDISVDELVGSDITYEEPNQHRLDTLGFVRGGIPMTAVENIIDFEDVDPKQYPGGRKEYFALKITGDSMSTLIDDKDVVIVHKQETVENGEIAIVLVNGEEATCKKIAFSEDGIMLISINPKYEPMFYSKEDIEKLPVTIIGKVVEIRKKL